MESESRDLLTVEQAASYLQLSQSSIRSYIRQGKLNAFRIAGKRKVLIQRTELLKLLEPARAQDVGLDDGLPDAAGDALKERSRPDMTPASSVVITARLGNPGLLAEARELWRFRHLIRTLVERDLRVRYKNSVVGIAWTMINPLVQVFVLTVAIGYILGSGPKNLSAYIFCATIPWTFFQTAILDSSSAILSKLGLLKKVYFPREIPLIATVCQNFVQFLISLAIFMIYRWVLTPLLFHGPTWPPVQILLLALADRHFVPADSGRGIFRRHRQCIL